MLHKIQTKKDNTDGSKEQTNQKNRN